MEDNKKNQIVIASNYFLYFGVLGIFLPYFNLYCYHLEFTGFQIGLLSALRTFCTIIFPLIWGILADRFHIRKPVYFFCNIVSTCLWFLYLYTDNFYYMVIITAIYGVFYSPIISFLEAFAVDALGKNKKSYGKIRVSGSISFILIVTFLGKIIDLYSIEIILLLIFIGSVIQSLFSFKIPKKDIPKSRTAPPGLNIFYNKGAMIFLICSFLMLLSHGTYYGFFSIHLEKAGFSKSFIGIAWAVATISEVVVMLGSNKIFNRYSLNNIIIFSFFTAAFRWLILYFFTSSVAILLSQLLHALTYGAFHMACVLYIDKITPKNAKTLGQVVYNSSAYGLGTMAGFIISGYFFESANSLLFLASSITAVFGGILFYFHGEKISN